MNILYFCYCPEEMYMDSVKQIDYYSTTVGAISQSKEFIKGMQENNVNITVVCLIPYKYYESRQKIVDFKSNNENYFYLKYLNYPILQEITRLISSFKVVRRWRKNLSDSKKSEIIVALNNYAPISIGILLSKNNISALTYTQDLVSDLYSDTFLQNMHPLKKILVGAYIKMTNWITERFDGYIYVAAGMAEKMNIKNKPSMVLEGIYDSNILLENYSIEKKNAILYAGSLHKKYGIEMILKVFQNIGDPRLELWICGSGEMEYLVKEYAKYDRRISYFGFIPHEHIMKLMKSAKLLINLRDPRLDYTRYCFPGKIFEYMMSGTPVFTTKTVGIYEEYYQYLFYSEEYDFEILSNNIESILKMNIEDLKKFGNTAKTYVEERASRNNQAKRVIKFSEEMIKM